MVTICFAVAVIRRVTRRPLQPHPNALGGHYWSPRGGRVCGSSGGLVRAVIW